MSCGTERLKRVAEAERTCTSFLDGGLAKIVGKGVRDQMKASWFHEAIFISLLFLWELVSTIVEFLDKQSKFINYLWKKRTEQRR